MRRAGKGPHKPFFLKLLPDAQEHLLESGGQGEGRAVFRASWPVGAVGCDPRRGAAQGESQVWGECTEGQGGGWGPRMGSRWRHSGARQRASSSSAGKGGLRLTPEGS